MRSDETVRIAGFDRHLFSISTRAWGDGVADLKGGIISANDTLLECLDS